MPESRYLNVRRSLHEPTISRDVRRKNSRQSPFHTLVTQDAPQPGKSNASLTDKWADVRSGLNGHGRPAADRTDPGVLTHRAPPLGFGVEAVTGCGCSLLIGGKKRSMSRMNFSQVTVAFWQRLLSDVSHSRFTLSGPPSMDRSPFLRVSTRGNRWLVTIDDPMTPSACRAPSVVSNIQFNGPRPSSDYIVLSL
jgi:hypothetical protein